MKIIIFLKLALLHQKLFFVRIYQNNKNKLNEISVWYDWLIFFIPFVILPVVVSFYYILSLSCPPHKQFRRRCLLPLNLRIHSIKVGPNKNSARFSIPAVSATSWINDVGLPPSTDINMIDKLEGDWQSAHIWYRFLCVAHFAADNKMQLHVRSFIGFYSAGHWVSWRATLWFHSGIYVWRVFAIPPKCSN